MTHFPNNLDELRRSYARSEIDGVTYRALRRAMVAAIASGALPPSPLSPLAQRPVESEASDRTLLVVADDAVDESPVRRRTQAIEVPPLASEPPPARGSSWLTDRRVLMGAGLSIVGALVLTAAFFLRAPTSSAPVANGPVPTTETPAVLLTLAAFLAEADWSSEAVDNANAALVAARPDDFRSERGQALMDRLRHAVSQRLDQERELAGTTGGDSQRMSSLSALARNAGVEEAAIASATVPADELVAPGTPGTPTGVDEPHAVATSPPPRESPPPLEVETTRVTATSGAIPVITESPPARVMQDRPPTVAVTQGPSPSTHAMLTDSQRGVREPDVRGAPKMDEAVAPLIRSLAPKPEVLAEEALVTEQVEPAIITEEPSKNPNGTASGAVARSDSPLLAGNETSPTASAPTVPMLGVSPSAISVPSSSVTKPAVSPRGTNGHRPCEAVNVAKVWTGGRIPASPRAAMCQDVLPDGLAGPSLIVVPPGTFQMGGNKPVEMPQHKVSLSRPIGVGRYEVTVGEFLQFTRATNRQYPSLTELSEELPIVNISWREASDYVAWLSQQFSARYRLPSEAEWEYFARAGASTRYLSGDVNPDPSIVGRIDQSPPDSPKSVKSGAPNGFFLVHVLGNAREWVADAWRATYAGAPDDGSAVIGTGLRVTRGGGFRDDADNLRLGSRMPQPEDDTNEMTGFRVVRDIGP